MKRFLALLKLNFKSLILTTTGSSTRKKSKQVGGVGALIILGILMLYISGFMSFALVAVAAEYNSWEAAFSLILFMAFLMPFMLTMFTAMGSLFSTKDADLVLSLPVSSFSILLSRIGALYLEILFMVELFLLPMGIMYIIASEAFGVSFLILLLFMGLFFAMLATTASVIFSFIISVITSRFKYKNLFITALSLGLSVFIFIYVFKFTNSSSEVEKLISSSDGSVINLAIIKWIYAAVNGNVLKLLLSCIVCAAPLFLTTWVFSLFYKKILTNLLSKHGGKAYKHKELTSNTAFATIFKKEAGKFFLTPSYVLNYGISIIMVIAGSVVALVKKQALSNFIGEIGVDSIIVFVGFFALLMWLVSIIMPAAVSISLEGKTLWILKESPLSTGKILGAKTGFNFLLQAATTVVSLIILGFAFEMPFIKTFLLILNGVALCGCFSFFAMLSNLWFPKMDAENETIVIKRSTSVMISMLVSIGVLVVYAGIIFICVALAELNFEISFIIAFAVLIIANIILKNYMLKKGKKVLYEI